MSTPAISLRFGLLWVQKARRNGGNLAVVSTLSCCLDCGTTWTNINVACWFGLRRWLWIEIPAATVTSVEPSADEFAQAQAETHASEQREAAEQAQIQVSERRCVLDFVLGRCG